ncbi:MAG: DNA translocase FtsK 4TM domain-containing protein [Clostridia bacterium]|nr:DNA translocase FtsK 4TM domain-containing protein [Clostridia bacterium]
MATKKTSSKGRNTKATVSKKRYKSTPVKKKAKQSNYATIVLSTAVLAIVLAIFIYFESAGVVGALIRQLLFGLFAGVAYLIPPVIGVLSIYTAKRKLPERFWLKCGLCFVCCVLVGAFIQLLTPGEIPKVSELWSLGLQGKGGGILGGLFAIFMNGMIGKAASCVITVVALFVLFSVIFKVNFISMIQSFFSGVSDEIGDIEDVDVSEQGRKVKQKVTKRIKESKPQFYDELAEAGADSVEQKPKKKKEKPEEAPSETEKENIEEIIPTEEFDADKFLEEVAAQLPQTESVKELMDEHRRSSTEDTQRVETTTKEEREQIGSEIDTSIEEKHEYIYPSLDILKKPGGTSGDKRKEMLETSKKLMETLKSFGVEAKLLQVTNGPAVTRYEIQLNAGVKISKITGLSEDIALNLAVPTVLVAPVPGKAAVGIEVPNNSVGLVCVRELLESDEFTKSNSKLTVALGKDIGGRVIIGDIGKFPHILIAGSTGSGKSVCINTIITSILYKASPDEVKLIMIDPKVVELGVYNGIPHLLIPVVTDPKRAAGALNWAVGEMMKRYSMFAETGTRNLDGYNEHIEKEGGEKMPKIVIIIDELADLMMVAAKEVEDYICRLAQLARAAGIHLIIATQRPSVDVITGLIKANVPSRIAFAVSSGVDSRTILDRVGAEKLLGKGDMLYHPTGKPNAVRVQGAFVTDDEVERLVDFVKENAEVTHYSHDLEEHIDRISTGEHGVTDEDDADDADALLPQAIELALELGQISTAMIQRRMKVGYARAGRIVYQMEQRGLISGANGSKPREVYSERIRATMDVPTYLGDDDE